MINSIPTERSAEGASENMGSFFLPNWSPLDDPARPLPAEGRPWPSYHDDDDDDNGDDRNEKDVIFFSLSRASHSKLDAGPEIL